MNSQLSAAITLLPLFLLLLSNFHTALADPLAEFCNKDNAKLNPGSSSRLAKLLSQLVAKAPADGYYATSSGRGRNKVHGLAQCRGDAAAKDCSTCIADAADQIARRCPGLPDGRIWYDKCFLRYSKTNFVGKLGNSPAVIFFNAENVTDPETFNAKLAGLEDEVRSQAVKPGSKGIGKGETKLLPPSAETIYAVVQCTRDLAAADCGRCLAAAVGYFADYCENKKGCRALLDGCYARYELYPF
ncbi:unnamed protein product [Linum tenue]|uniref:Gnk2-homologous domain-containing protein n=1 Tax=Linum tenue TaxID=586396 RepID=A0AAV0HR68_9ROSI|nr:unnamed protein product [Linum tenue]